jgi:hypothetical protein
MKITKKQLKHIIKEELENVLQGGSRLRDNHIDPESLIEELSTIRQALADLRARDVPFEVLARVVRAHSEVHFAIDVAEERRRVTKKKNNLNKQSKKS